MTGRVAVLLAFFSAGLCQAVDEPRLVLDTGGHQGLVEGMAFTPDGKYVVTAGEDKVVRVWDWRTGDTVRLISGQVAEGPQGTIYALAVSADGRYLAVGGLLAGTDTAKRYTPEENVANQSAIRVHDLRTGKVVALLHGHKNSVTALAFSPQDSRYLASGSTDHTVALWDVQRSQRIREFRGHSEGVYAVAFAPDGSRLVSASPDKTVRIWRSTGGAIQTLKGHTDAVVTALFTPDGRYVISGSEDATVRLWNADTGKEERTIAHLGTQMSNLSVSPDGQRLLVCFQSGTQAERQYPCQILALNSGQPLLHFRQHQDAVRRTAFSPDGRLAATAGGVANEILVWDAGSGKAVKLTGKGLPVVMVGYAQDGRSIAFGVTKKSQRQVNAYGDLQRKFLLDPNNPYRIGLGPAVTRDSDYLTAQTTYRARGESYEMRSVPGTELDDQILQVVRNGAVRHRIERNNTSGYKHAAYTFTHDGRYFITGGLNGYLTIYQTESGKKVNDFIGHTGAIWSVAVSQDNTTLVSGSDDQTMKLWDIASGRNILTIFVASDREDLDWVAWTPEGYYTSSLNGDEYIGWHINGGVGSAARYVEAAELRSEFYRPDVVAEFLKSRNIANAFQVANAVSGDAGRTLMQPVDVAGILPPTVTLESAPPRATWKVTANIASSLPITAVRVFQNGFFVPVSRMLTLQQDALHRSIEIDLPVLPGRNTVYVTASNTRSTSRGDSDTISAASLPASPDIKPNLYVLAVGVNQYKTMQKLKYAVQDARAVVDLLKAQRNGLFGDVKAEILADDKASPDSILAALKKINGSMNEHDTRLVFLAGHGKLYKNRYYFLGPDFSGDDFRKGGLSWDDLIQELTPGVEETIRGRTILMVDTCRAAAVSDDPTIALKSTSLQKGGLVTFAAATSNQNSEENDMWGHGAFTKALLEALTTRSDREDERFIFTDELGVRIRKGVMKLTDKQIPVSIALPIGLPPFALFQLPER